MYTFSILFFMFFVYSVAGFIAELIFCTIVDKKLVLNRGFLIGPYCPIYGVSAVIMATTLFKYNNSIVIVFAMGALIATTLEYITSYLMEVLFKTRWWDYSGVSFNVNGRVCLKNSVLFGLGSIAIIYFLDYWYKKIVFLFDKEIFMNINVVLLIIIIVDIVLSTNIIVKIRRNSELAKRDMTDEIKEKVKYELSKNLALTKRLLNSFPRVFTNVRTIVKKLDRKQKR